MLSAIATVSWTTEFSFISVRVGARGEAEQTTPPVVVFGSSSPLVVPVLPLRAQTAYTFQASGINATGGVVTSSQVTLTTEALPSGVPVFTEVGGGTPIAGVTLVARLPIDFPSTDYLTISDGTGAPIWYYPAIPTLGGDFQQQPDGTFTVAVDDPTHVITGFPVSLTVYRQIDVLGDTLATWSAQDVPDAGITITGTDDHDIRLQPDGDALLFGFTQKIMDLSAHGGQARASVVADVLERVTPAGTVSFAWNSFDHLAVENIDPAATVVTGAVIDFTHGNSIDVMDDGNYLISLRNLSQILKIDAMTGDIIWRLGGTDGNFTFFNDSLSGFSCQHGARELPSGDIILFDDGDGHDPPQSRAVEYALDTTTMTATFIWSAEDFPSLYSYSLGYAQRLANGNTLIAYGTARHVQEVDPSGSVLWDLFDPTASFGIYRAYRLDTLSPLALTAE